MRHEAQHARAASKEKARRLTRHEQLSTVLDHHKQIVAHLEAELQAASREGRPKRHNGAKHVGHVEGEHARSRADRKPRRSAQGRGRYADGGSPSNGDPSWSEVADDALQNLRPSVANLGRDAATAVMHPVQTVQTLGKAARGVASQAAGALGFQQDPSEARNRAAAQSLERQYGSVSGLKRGLAKDPVRYVAGPALLAGE